MTNVFNNPDSMTEEQEIEAAINEYKKRFVADDGKVDLEAILKKVAHGDRHIKTLEKEAQERGSNSQAAAKLEEILAKIEAKSIASGRQTPESESSEGTPREVDLDKLVEEKLQSYETKKAYERNVQFAQSELEKLWGPDYLVKLRARARELGESEQFLSDLAATRPQTFLNLVKDTKTEQPDRLFVPPQGQRITSSNKSGAKSYADFEKIRKENPTLYKTKAIQDELFRLTAEYAAQGKSFVET